MTGLLTNLERTRAIGSASTPDHSFRLERGTPTEPWMPASPFVVPDDEALEWLRG